MSLAGISVGIAGISVGIAECEPEFRGLELCIFVQEGHPPLDTRLWCCILTVSFYEWVCGRHSLNSVTFVKLVFMCSQVSNGDSSLVSRQVLPQNQLTKFNFDQVNEIEERVVLLQKLEKAEGRIMALEKQVDFSSFLFCCNSYTFLLSDECFPKIFK